MPERLPCEPCAAKSLAVFSDTLYVDAAVTAGGRLEVPRGYKERAIYIAEGRIEIAGDVFEAGRMLVFTSGQPILFTAVTPAVVMLLGGDPIGERFIEWNFVSSSQARIEQAKADWRAGRMKLPVNDETEFVPLP